ncbi:hypothetical protein Tco_0949923, partial [Tanacetum coccineum]
EGEGLRQPSEPQPTPSYALPSHEVQVTTVASHPQKTHTPRRAKRGWDTEIPQSSGPPKKVGDEAVYTGEDDKVVRATTTTTSLEAEQESGSGPRCQDTTLGDADAQTRFETASKQSRDPPLSEVNTSGSGEDSMEYQDDLTNFVPPTPHDLPLLGGHTPGSDEGRPNINELMAICTKLSNRVLALETSKTAQDLVIKKLKKKVKRLEKKQRARTSGMKLFKIGTSKRKSLDKENLSKQGRNLKTRSMIEEGDFDDDFDDIDDMVNEASVKRQKIEDDAENEDLRAYLDIIPGDDEAVNVESLAIKYLIVDWKTHVLLEDRWIMCFIKGDGSTKFYKIFTEMLDDFDRQDVLDLYRLVKERFETASPEGYDRLC